MGGDLSTLPLLSSFCGNPQNTPGETNHTPGRFESSDARVRRKFAPKAFIVMMTNMNVQGLAYLKGETPCYVSYRRWCKTPGNGTIVRQHRTDCTSKQQRVSALWTRVRWIFDRNPPFSKRTSARHPQQYHRADTNLPGGSVKLTKRYRKRRAGKTTLKPDSTAADL